MTSNDSISPALHVSGLIRRFGDFVALDDVTFDVKPGEVLALLGENGAGKTTLVEILGGNLRAHGGSMSVQGLTYAPQDARRARKSGVAVVHQHFQLVDAFRVSENLRLAVGAWSRERIARQWADLERRLGQDLPALNRLVIDLGVGERQWLEIGKAMLEKPRVLLLDEPTAVLTPQEAERLFSVIAELKEEGVAVVFITHRLDEVERIADRVVVLRRGRVVAELKGDAPPEALARSMIGEVELPGPRARLQASSIVVKLRGVAAPPRLEPTDLEICAGEIVVLAGVDGNGQVALAERVAGLLEGPGTVEIAGGAVAEYGRLRPGVVAVVPGDRQGQGLMPSMSVAENLMVGREAGRIFLNPGLVLAEGRDLVSGFAVAGRAEQPVSTLSGGNQQKVVVARALAAKPSVLVAIHPTRGLDVAAQSAIQERIAEAARGGAAVLVVSADLDEAMLLGDRVIVFSHGRIVGEGGPETSIDVLARWVGGDAA